MNRSCKILSVNLSLFLFFLACTEEDKTGITKSVIIDIQPYKGFSDEVVKQVANQIQSFYPYVTILPEISLPVSSFYPTRNRYRADSLIKILGSSTAVDQVTIGLTNKDISTKKGEIIDWGIMGLGFRPGNACVVSTFRLKKKNLSSQFYKVCIHELGHTAGLNHCPEKTCFMREADGGNPIDEETAFCNKCRKVLIKKGWKIKLDSEK